MAGTSDNGSIAKNTLYLYIRTGVVMFVMLFSTRILFKALGVDDMGIYNVVAGVVAIMSFFLSSLTTSTIRFLSFELGKADADPGKTFSLCLTIHLLVAAAVLVLGETVGLLIVNRLTEIPPERMFAANVVYQFALAIFCLNIVRVPYDAAIVAHERMKIYAVLSIVEAVFQLSIALLVYYMAGDALINYGWLQFTSILLLFLLYVGYLRKTEPAYRFSIAWDQKASLKILSFSSWVLLGTFFNSVTLQGITLLFNNFVGLVANAALGFANQVNGAVARFLNSFILAFNPQINKLCASNEVGKLNLLVFRASKFSFVLVFALALPLMLNMEMLLGLWLGEAPQYTADFCRLILVCTILDAVTGPYGTAINATGDIRNYQIWVSISYFLGFVLAFIFLLAGMHPASVFIARILTRGVMCMFIGLYFCRTRIAFNIISYMRSVIAPTALTTVITLIPSMAASALFEDGWLHLLITTAVAEAVLLISMYAILCSSDEREFIRKCLKEKIFRHSLP